MSIFSCFTLCMLIALTNTNAEDSGNASMRLPNVSILTIPVVRVLWYLLKVHQRHKCLPLLLEVIVKFNQMLLVFSAAFVLTPSPAAADFCSIYNGNPIDCYELLGCRFERDTSQCVSMPWRSGFCAIYDAQPLNCVDLFGCGYSFETDQCNDGRGQTRFRCSDLHYFPRDCRSLRGCDYDFEFMECYRGRTDD